jgi:hypothetical protein
MDSDKNETAKASGGIRLAMGPGYLLNKFNLLNNLDLAQKKMYNIINTLGVLIGVPFLQ